MKNDPQYPFPEVKLEIFIPIEYVEALRKALAAAGAGRIGNYDSCCSITEVGGTWRPLEGANPFLGEVGKVEEGREAKVEVNCKVELLEDVLRVIKQVHPYEEPLINVLPLLNHLFGNL